MSTFHVCMLIVFEIFVITTYNDQLFSVMSNLHTELYKCMIFDQYLTFLQQNHYFSVLTVTHCMF